MKQVINPTRKPNGIETKNDINCGTCSLKSRCRFMKSERGNITRETTCKYYTNETKGIYEEKKKSEAVK